MIARLAFFLSLVGTATAQCAWNATAFLENGVDNTVFAQALWDDGNGESLYVGGNINEAGGLPASRVARFDGTSWSALGGTFSGTLGSSVRSMIVFDDGSGEALWVGGSFQTLDGSPCPYLARWNGSSWSCVGFDRSVRAMAVFDDGNGPALYVAGNDHFFSASPYGRVARWTGSGWVTVRTFDTIPAVLKTLTTSTGTHLYVGGSASLAPASLPTPALSRYDGATWEDLSSSNGVAVNALETWDDGGGSALYIGGQFSNGFGNIARLDGASLTPLGIGLDNFCSDLVKDGDGPGSSLYACGAFLTAGGLASEGVARWNGATWSDVAGSVARSSSSTALVYDLLPVPTTSGLSEIYLGGYFDRAGPLLTRNVARWTGSSWRTVGAGGALNSGVTALATLDSGTGSILYAGGRFTYAGGLPVNYVARWDGASWADMDGGLSGLLGNPSISPVPAMRVYDDGGGPDLYVAGNFTMAGSIPASGIARWTGATWEPLGSGLNWIIGSTLGAVRSIAVHDDGTGASLFVGGLLTMAGGQPVNYIAEWDGNAWSPVGGGLPTWVRDIKSFDDGTGPALYATIGATSGAVALHRWDGATWSPIGLIRNGMMAVYDDGGGPGLYIAQGSDGLWRWRNGQLTQVPLPAPASAAGNMLHVYDDGTGPALYVGLTYASWSQVSIDVGRYDGTWTLLGAGLNQSADVGATHEGDLWVGGIFQQAVGLPAKRMTRLVGCGASLGMTISQSGIGGPVYATNANLVPGHVYANLVSTTPCATLGTGPFAGLCAPNASPFIAQLTTPLDASPFHYRAREQWQIFGPYTGLPAATIDAVLLDITGGQLNLASPVTRFAIQ